MGDQYGTPDGAGARLGGQHHVVEHEGLAAVGEAAAVEGGDGGVQDPGHVADGGGRDRAPEQGQQNLADPAGGQAEHEAGEDDPVDLANAAHVAPQHGGGAVAAGPRQLRLDVAGFAEQAAPIGSVAAVAAFGAAEPAVDILRQPCLDDPGRGLARRLPATNAPI